MTTQSPGPPEDVDLVDLAGGAGDGHPPGLHPVDVITGARQGFTTEQGQGVLGDANLLALLARRWRSQSPTLRVWSLAQQPGARGSAHLRLLERTGQFIRLDSRSRYGLAAGTSDQGPEILVDGDQQDQGTVVVRRLFNDQGLMDIVIESVVSAADSFPVVALYALTEDEQPAPRLLFLLVPTPAGHQRASHAECRLRVDPALTSDRLSLFPFPFEASELSEPLLTLVGQSVTVAKLPWKDAWRRAALATPDGHPLRAAVLGGLSART